MLAELDAFASAISLDITQALHHGDVLRLKAWIGAALSIDANGITIGLTSVDGGALLSLTWRLPHHGDDGARVCKEWKPVEHRDQVLSDDRAVIVSMLGLMPHMDEDVGDEEDLLANESVRRFAARTGVAMVDIKSSKTRHEMLRMKITLCPMAFIKDRCSGYHLWRYSRSYVRKDKAELVDEMVEEIWRRMQSQRYILHEQLKQALSGPMRTYIAAGITGDSETFAPRNANLNVYLWGGAGIGKSTFVHVYAKAWSLVLSRYFKKGLGMDVVKVPLNSLTPDELGSILRVQGISDWSIERIVEQSLVKGNLVLLHLEENPRDKDLQARMIARVQAMIGGLLSKYLHVASNVVFVFTSNYEPCEAIKNFCINVRLSSVQKADQLTWALSVLRDKVGEHSQGSSQLEIDIEESMYAPCSEDMRPLNIWCLTLGYYISKLIDGENSIQKSIQARALGEETYVVESGSQRCILRSRDGFFFHDTQASELETVFNMTLDQHLSPGVIAGSMEKINDDVKKSLLVWGANNHVHLRITSVSLLEERDSIKVFGSPSEIRGGLFKFIDDTNNKNAAHRPIRDCIVCGDGRECVARRESRRVMAVVIATVNALGQFMLRELLESPERSRTHRLGISKVGVLFLVSTTADSPFVTTQLVSRATVILS